MQGNLSEAELLTQFSMMGQRFLTALQTTFAIVSAYVTALHYFLGTSEPTVKIVAFAFFSAVLALLGAFLLGATIYSEGVAVALNEASGRSTTSGLARLVTRLLNHWTTYGIAYGSAVFGFCLYAALGYLTFWHNWPTRC